MMSIRVAPVAPAFRFGLIGLAAALLGAGCSSQPAGVALAPIEMDEIELTSEAIFGSIALAEIEITVESIEDESVEVDGHASTEIPVEDPSRSAAAGWLASIEAVTRAESAPAPAPRAVATKESYGASGGGVGLSGTSFGSEPPTHFAPIRKSLASRDVAPVTGVASIAAPQPSAGGAAVAGVERTQVAAPAAPSPLDAEAIKVSVSKQMPRVRACYERALKNQQGLEGKLVMAWQVRPNGTVRSVSVSDDQLGSDKVAMCVVEAVANFRFPEGTETVAVEYPMSFKSTW